MSGNQFQSVQVASLAVLWVARYVHVLCLCTWCGEMI